MKPRELIATHTNTDFDAFAAMVVARKLYPEAAICLSNAVNRNVREFHNLYADEIETVDPGAIDLAAVRRLILVDTVYPNRLGELASLCGREGVDVIVFDHHRHDDGLPPFVHPENFIGSEDGSLVTLLLQVVAERGIALTPLEATTCALGIHEDTGSLTFSTTTTRDAEALAYCMRSGADPAAVERYLNAPLSAGQREIMAAALADARPLDVPSLEVVIATVRQQEYVEGVSVVAHRVMDLAHADAFFLLVEMERRVFVTARSHVGSLDVGRILGTVGGGGHAVAASAVIKNGDLDEVCRRLEDAIRMRLPAGPVARDLMTPVSALDVTDQAKSEVAIVDVETSVDKAIVICQRLHLGGVVIRDGDVLVGAAARADLGAAARHRLGHAPVKAVMTSRVRRAGLATPAAEVERLLTDEPIGWLPVVGDSVAEPPRADDVLGVITRRAAVHGGVDHAPQDAVEHPQSPAADVSELLAGLELDDLFAEVQAVATGYRGVYLVGGAVRDLLLGERTIDIDLAVEGNGIEFARELAERLKGRLREHAKFQSAVIVVPGARLAASAAASRRSGATASVSGAAVGQRLRIDVASTRTEFYDFPAALPKVEHASISSDLSRRDFTINAMAISLQPENFGALLDPFAGMADLEAGRIVVLHALSFIEDPTRIFRALRYESRYGLRMDTHTWNLARTCVELDLVGDLSSARLRDELVLLLGEPTVEPALRRLEELGLERAVHPRFGGGEAGRALVRRGDDLWRQLELAGEVPLWRLRLIWLLRDLEPEELAAWAASMRLRRRDATVLARAMVVGRRLAGLIGRGPSEAELYDATVGEPAEALLAAIVVDPSDTVSERAARYLRETRHTRLAIAGQDLIALGFASSPQLGEVMRGLLHLKLNGVIAGREQELEAARRMLYP